MADDRWREDDSRRDWPEDRSRHGGERRFGDRGRSSYDGSYGGTAKAGAIRESGRAMIRAKVGDPRRALPMLAAMGTVQTTRLDVRALTAPSTMRGFPDPAMNALCAGIAVPLTGQGIEMKTATTSAAGGTAPRTKSNPGAGMMTPAAAEKWMR